MFKAKPSLEFIIYDRSIARNSKKQKDYWTESYIPAQFLHVEDHVKARDKYVYIFFQSGGITATLWTKKNKCDFEDD